MLRNLGEKLCEVVVSQNLIALLVWLNPKCGEGELRGKRLINLDIYENPTRFEIVAVIVLSALGLDSVAHRLGSAG